MKRKSSISQVNGPLPTDEQLFAMVEHAIRHEKGYLDKDLNREILAERMGIHRNSLSRVVNRFTGVNFPTYVASLRLAEVKRLVHTKKHSKVTELAAEAGFASRMAFYRAAKKVADVSASLFIKTEKANR